MIGEHIVHSNHLFLVYDRFDFAAHGLTLEDVDRTDRQNWRSAQRITFQCVQECLRKLQDGDLEDRPPDPSVTGTRVFLIVMWHYVEIFCSQKATLSERIRAAGLVAYFLAIWHNFIKVTPGLTLQKNFLSRETYIDVLLSCHFSVSLICFMRDEFPDVECHLELTGTDVVENYFSKCGQWVGNRNNYTYARMERNLRHMIRLEEIRVNPQAPEFARPHPKGELIWAKQYTPPWVQATQLDYPAVGAETDLWLEGKHMAMDLARQGGMLGQDMQEVQEDAPGPPDDPPDGMQWFYEPFQFNGNNLYATPPDAAHAEDGDDEDGCSDGTNADHPLPQGVCVWSRG